MPTIRLRRTTADRANSNHQPLVADRRQARKQSRTTGTPYTKNRLNHGCDGFQRRNAARIIAARLVGAAARSPLIATLWSMDENHQPAVVRQLQRMGADLDLIVNISLLKDPNTTKDTPDFLEVAMHVIESGAPRSATQQARRFLLSALNNPIFNINHRLSVAYFLNAHFHDKRTRNTVAGFYLRTAQDPSVALAKRLEVPNLAEWISSDLGEKINIILATDRTIPHGNRLDILDYFAQSQEVQAAKILVGMLGESDLSENDREQANQLLDSLLPSIKNNPDESPENLAWATALIASRNNP